MGSGRASKPAPLSIGRQTSDSSSRQNSFGSDSTDHEVPRTFSDSWANYNQAKERTSPSSSSQSRSKSFKSSKATSPTANVYTHCGRHSNQWLFGDVNMTDLFRRNKKD
ncbi:hypothetical protein PG994_010183 [Apiospora phragmitis]|uniref:Uncharacterized protein n=1 Tax=Apiospora phragmitis TaxID=2905665 RepID=A0ABR1TRV4_9PEZI